MNHPYQTNGRPFIARARMIVLALLAWVMAGPGSLANAATTTNGPEFTAAEQAWIARQGEVRVGVDPDWPPFLWRDDAERWQGIDADLLELIRQKSGLKLTIIPTKSWQETVERALLGEIDLTVATSRTAQREQMANFTSEYCAFPVVIVSREEGPFLTSYAQVDRLRIAAPARHVFTERLRADHPNGRFTLVDNVEQALVKVSVGECDIAMANLAVAAHVIRNRGLSNLKIAGVMPYEFPLRYAVRKDAPELLGVLEKTLTSISVLDREEVFAKWILPDVRSTANWHTWRRIATFVLLGAASLIALALFSNWRMSGEIASRRRAETELRAAHDELRTLHDEQSWLLNVVSHDMKNAVQTIALGTGLLQGKPAAHEPSLLLPVQSIGDAALRLDRLVKNILNTNAIEHGKITVRSEPTDAISVVREVTDQHRSVLELKQSHLVIDLPAQALILGDGVALAETLENLLANAVRVTPAGGTVTLQVERRAGQVRFSVRDEGPGLNPQEATAVLKMESQAPTKLTTAEGSSGLGLRIVRYFVQQMRGKIWCESEPGHGATFIVEIPEAP